MKEVGNLGIIIYTQTYESIYTQLRRQQFTFLQLHALFFLQQSIKRLHKIRKDGKEYNWDVSNINGAVKTELSASTDAKFSLRPIPLAWLNSLSNGQELGNNPGWE